MPTGRGDGVKSVPSTTPAHGYCVLSPVSLASRDQDGDPVGLNDRHLRSYGKIGDYEQQTKMPAGNLQAGSKIISIRNVPKNLFSLKSAEK